MCREKGRYQNLEMEEEDALIFDFLKKKKIAEN